MESLDPQAVALAKAIRQTESGGDFNAKGKSGEFGAYQFMPATWQAYAREAGVPAMFGSATPEQQNEVAYKKIKKWKDQGYNPGQIASMWNAGPGKPNAYIDGNKGTNSQGVSYDTKAYAEKVAKAYQSLKGQQTSPSGAVAAPFVHSKPNGTDLESGQEKDGLVNKLLGRVGQLSEAAKQPSLLRGLLRAGGAVTGGINDVIGSTLSAVTPDIIEKPISKAVGSVVGAGLNTEVGQSLVGAYEGLDPELKKDLGALGNIASLVPVGKGLSLAKGAVQEAIPNALKIAVKEGGEGLVGTAAKKALVNQAIDIVAPKETASVLKKGIKSGRGEVKGLLGNVSVSPDARTIRAAEAASTVVKKSKTLTENANLVRKEIGNVAEKLENDLSTMEITPIVLKEDMDNLVGNALKEIGENPTMVGDAARSAELILNKFKSFLPQGSDVTAVDVLRARKQLDRWLDSQVAGDVFNPNFETAKSVALRSIRQGANDLVASKAPDVAVREALSRQTALYDALENISAKAVKEVGTSGPERFAKRHPVVSGLMKHSRTAAFTGMGIGAVDNLFGK